MSEPVLRQYQIDDIEKLREGFKQYSAGILCQPTGSGKGHVASYMVHRAQSFGHRILFVVFGQPLVLDMLDRVTDLGIEAGMIMGSGKSATRKPWLPTQVASISTLWRRQHLPKASLVICDEVQDCTSRTYQLVLRKYIESGAKILGMSGTPIGPNGIGLGKKAGGIFEFMVTGPSVKKLVRDGFLVSCKLYCFDVDSLKGIKKKGDDYDQNALAALAAANAHRVGDIVGNWKQYASDRKTASFGIDKADATRIKEQFSVSGINATTVFDDTPAAQRLRIWDDLARGDLRVVSSVNVIGRGWNVPACKCVIDAAPTLSIQKALQRWGRGSRPFEDFKDFILLDMAGNYHQHGRYEADRIWTLEGGDVKTFNDGEPDFRIKRCSKCGHQFKLGPKACPRCGHVIPIKEREVREANGHLKLIDIEEEQQVAREQERKEDKRDAIADWASRATDEQKLKKLEEWKAKAKKEGYSIGWAFNTFRRTFNCEPPRIPRDDRPTPPEIRDTLNKWSEL